MDKTNDSAVANFDSRINDKAAEITANAIALLGERFTPNLLHKALLFDAAWARVKLEDQLRATGESNQLNRKLMAITEELLEMLKRAQGESVAELRDWSERASVYHAAVEQTTAALLPLAERGEGWTKTQRKNGFKRFEEEQEKHDSWRQWQASEKAANPTFEKYSKEEQARRLKKKHSITDATSTIAKRLDPQRKRRRA